MAKGVVVQDAPGRIVASNPAAREILGLEIDELTGLTSFDPQWKAVWEDGTPTAGRNDPATIARTTGQPVTDVVMAVRHSSGVLRWLQVSARPLRDSPADPVTGVVISFLDITERRRVEQALGDAEALLQNLIEGAEAAIFAVDPLYRYTVFNTRHADIMRALYGVEIELGRSLLEYQRPSGDDVQAKRNLDRALAGEHFTDEAFSGEEARTRAYFEVTHGPVRDQHGEIVGVAVFARDTSTRQRAEEEIRRLTDRLIARTAALEMSNHELEAFSYSVSHDLRAPLRAIDAFSQILLDEHAERLDPEGRRVLGVVLRNTKQMGVLIDDLLAFSRVTRKDLDRQPVEMNRLVRATVEEMRAAEPTCDITCDIGDLCAVPGDPALLRQVWTNLLGNAAKFSRSVAGPRVEVRCERGDGECRYTVRDNGVGFDPVYVDKLFKPFSRLHPTAEFEGTGIGLAIVARIVGRHGGRVWAEGTPGGGALFGFALPAERETA
jgi:PAS domain S-box-containing protein